MVERSAGVPGGWWWWIQRGVVRSVCLCVHRIFIRKRKKKLKKKEKERKKKRAGKVES
jgi:hypothetical protein